MGTEDLGQAEEPSRENGISCIFSKSFLAKSLCCCPKTAGCVAYTKQQCARVHLGLWGCCCYSTGHLRVNSSLGH